MIVTSEIEIKRNEIEMKKTKSKNEIGQNIQRYRHDKDWTQDQLADAVFSTKSTISKWENGEIVPSVDVIKIIAKALGVSLYKILGEKAPLGSKIINFIGRGFLWAFVWVHIDVTLVGTLMAVAAAMSFAGFFAGLGGFVTQVVSMALSGDDNPIRIALSIGYLLTIPAFFVIFQFVAFILYVPARTIFAFSLRHFWKSSRVKFKFVEFAWLKRITHKQWTAFWALVGVGVLYMIILFTVIAIKGDWSAIQNMAFK